MAYMHYTEVLIRITCSFFVLLILTRLMGKAEISQLNVFTFITAITIGNIAASLTTEAQLEIYNGVLALTGWAVLTILMSILNLKSRKARRLITGEPAIVIKQGKIMEKTLRKVGLDFETLQGMLRQQSVFSIQDVEYAIFEINGSLSVMKKQDKDTNATWKKAYLFPTSTGVIMEGEMNEDALREMHLQPKWLYEQLKKAGVNSVKDVCYAEIQTDGSLYIDFKNDQLEGGSSS